MLRNKATGHRRLNVLFTRAKKRVTVFSSMLPDQIEVQADSAWGARALKGYLAYAQSGVLDQAQISDREPDSDFEVEVAEALRERGFEIQPQVGVAGYFIDIVVKHPNKPDAYILAVECDGATYHSSLSARDRDRLRQEILENLGWKVHRVWSADWFKSRKREADRIVDRIQQILREEKAADRLIVQQVPSHQATVTRVVKVPPVAHSTSSEKTIGVKGQEPVVPDRGSVQKKQQPPLNRPFSNTKPAEGIPSPLVETDHIVGTKRSLPAETTGRVQPQQQKEEQRPPEKATLSVLIVSAVGEEMGSGLAFCIKISFPLPGDPHNALLQDLTLFFP